MVTLKNIEAQNTYKDKVANFVIPKNMPSNLTGDSYRFCYIIKKLILNGHNRSQTYQSAIHVKFRYIKDLSEWTEQLDNNDGDDYYDEKVDLWDD